MARQRLRRWRRAGKWAAWAVAVLIVLPVALAGTALRAQYAGAAAPQTTTRGRDALWLGHAWVDGRRDASDVAALRRRIEGSGIRDLYVHAGPLEHDGTLPPARRAYPRARWLIGALHRALPSVRVHAWLGDRLVYEAGERGGLRLSDAAARRAIVASARQVRADGFMRRPSGSGAAALRQRRLSAAAGPARARGPGGRRAVVRRRAPDRSAARTAHGQRGGHGPPQVDIPALLRAGGTPGRPDRADVVRHRHRRPRACTAAMWRSRPGWHWRRRDRTPIC